LSFDAAIGTSSTARVVGSDSCLGNLTRVPISNRPRIAGGVSRKLKSRRHPSSATIKLKRPAFVPLSVTITPMLLLPQTTFGSFLWPKHGAIIDAIHHDLPDDGLRERCIRVRSGGRISYRAVLVPDQARATCTRSPRCTSAPKVSARPLAEAP
jgi:hypothetical protein